MNDDKRCLIFNAKATNQRRYRFAGKVHECCRLGQSHTLLTDSYLVYEGAFLARFQAAAVAAFKQVNNSEAHIVARAIKLTSGIA